MAALDQFSQGTTNSIDDFQGEAPNLPPVSNDSSNQSIAAHTALLAPRPDQVVPTFNQTHQELSDTGESQTQQAVVADARSQNQQALRTTTADMLTDPTKSAEWKQNAIEQVNNPQSPLYRVRAMVATQQAQQTVPNESQESTDLRGVYAGAINRVLDFQRQKQVFINQQQLIQNNEKAAGIVGAAEDFVPLVSGYKTASLANDLAGGGAVSKAWQTILPGEATQDTVDKFNSVPFEQRQAVMQKAMDVIAKHGTSILLPEEYDQGNLQAFRDMVNAGEYTATDRTINNVLGVLDTVGVLGFLRKAAGLAGEASNLTRAADAGGPSTARAPTPDAEWRQGGNASRGTFDQNGNPVNQVPAQPTGTEVARPLQTINEPLSIEEQNWSRNLSVSDVQPTSSSQVIKDANPTMARNLHDAVEKDTNGDVASALYGTTREDAIAHDIMPTVGTVDGSVESKVFHAEKNSDFDMMPDADVLDFVDNSGASWLTPAEKRTLSANAVNDFQNATGMVNRKEMGSVTATDDGVQFSAVYGPTDSGWSDVRSAVDSALFHLRDYGVTPDQVSVMVRDGDSYKALSIDQAARHTGDTSGDFLLKVDHEHKFNAADLENDGFTTFDVKRNFLDRWFPGGGNRGEGTLNSSLFDPQSMLNPGFTKGATIGGLRGAQLEKRLMQTAKPYVDKMKGMDKASQGMVYGKIREANAKGQSFNYANLKAEGFNQDQITALEHWKSTQDTLFHIENRDLIKTMSTRGYGLIDHADSGTRLIARELPRNQVKEGTHVYDPLTDTVRPWGREELSAHYEGGGSVARTVSPVDLDGGHVEHVLVHNKPGSTYVRKLNNNDQLLNYRKGYYAVRYNDPHFIEQRIVDANGRPLLDEAGNEQWKTVATAANIPDARRAVDRLTATKGVEHRYRNNVKGEGFDRATAQSITAGGRSAQRVRGKRLEEAVGSNNVSEQANIESPIQSMLHSISATSSRVGYRDWIETAKRRFVAQYEDVLPKENGMTNFPTERSQIGLAGQKTSKMAGDARTTFEYIRMMENGYNNTIDDGWKAMMNGVADLMGEKGLGKAEQVARGVGAVGPAGLGRSLAFNLYLASNPLRQFLLQSHQVMMLGANFPRYVFTGNMMDDLTLMSVKALGGAPSEALLRSSRRTAEEAEAMWKALESSGISAGISKHAMVRESLGSIADAANAAASGSRLTAGAAALTRPVSNLLNLSRKAGFDAGEWLSTSASFLAHYDQAVNSGKKMTQAAIDDITVQSRNYVYNMDKSGSIAWSHNSASLITQFMEQPYKAILQMTTNRGISWQKKAALVTFMGMMYGTHSMSGLVPQFDSIIETYANQLLPNETASRQILLNGMEGVALNTMFSKMYGQPVNLDYSSFSPLDSYGLFEFTSNLFSEDAAKIISSTPSGSLLFGSNPRITNLMKTTSALLGFGGSEYENNPVTWSNLMMDAVNLTSGTSNAYKAMYALNYQQKVSALGGLQDKNVNTVEALAQAIGLPTLDQSKSQHLSDMLYQNSQQVKGDVQKVFQNISRVLTQDGITPDNYRYSVAMAQAAMSAFKGNPVMIQEFQSLMRQQTAKDDRLMTGLLRNCGIIPKAEVIKYINNLPDVTEEQRQNLLGLCQTISNNEGNK